MTSTSLERGALKLVLVAQQVFLFPSLQGGELFLQDGWQRQEALQAAEPPGGPGL